MADYVGNDAQNSFTLAETGVTAIALSEDEKTLYAATTNGKIKVFDVATHALTNTWNVGKSLAGLSLSADGKTLVASGVTTADQAAVFAISTSTGTSTRFTASFGEFRDIQFAGANTVLVSEVVGGTLNVLDIKTGTFGTPLATSQSPWGYVYSKDEHLTLIAETNGSNGQLYMFDDRTGTIVAQGNNFYPPVLMGFNLGIQAISEVAGLVLQYRYSNSINIYDLSLNPIKNIGIDHALSGIIFDETGRFIYTLSSVNTVDQYRVSDWAKVATFDATEPILDRFDGNDATLKVTAGAQQIIYLSYQDRLAPKAALTLIDLTSRNEVFKGTSGADTFAGGLGNDTYTINNSGDRITELANGGTDKVVTAMAATLARNVEDLQLVGSAAINGTGNTLDNTLTGNAGINTLDGGNGNDRLVGIGGGDTLLGGAGNDTLVSGRGIDTLIGGTGGDTYVINDLADVITENAGGGTDTVQAAFSYTLGSTLENLLLLGKAANGTGNALANTITGNLVANTLSGGDGNDKLFGLAGRDILLGGAGNDLLDGGTGHDMLTGGAGNDTYIVDHARDVIVEDLAGGGTDTVIAAINWTLGDALENLTLAPGTAPLNGTGNALANTLTGNGGNNRLDGGLGADKMTGGLGDDTYVVDNRGDRTIEAFTGTTAGGTDTVQSSVSWTLTLGTENLTLAGSADINGTGNYVANVITGNAGDNVLDGGGADSLFGGIDTLIGGKGNDTYIADRYYFYAFAFVEQAGEGTDRVLSNASYDALPDNIENLVLGGTENFSGGGNALANVITGNTGDNNLYGYDGDDTLNGGAGADTLRGGAGANVLTGGAGADTFVFEVTSSGNLGRITDFGNGGNDRIDLSAVDANAALDGDQAFTLIDGAAFSGARGELRYVQSGGNTIVTADVNGDKLADFTLRLDGAFILILSDFVL